MTWRTHLLGGISTLWLIVPLQAVVPANLGVAAAVAAFGALLPDLDATQSKIRSLELGGIQPFDPIGRAANGLLGHRGFLHSPKAVAVVAAFAAVLSYWTGPICAVALWLGYTSHLALDACTKNGIPGLSGRIYLAPPQMRVVTGSSGEDAYFMMFAFSAAALLLSQLSAFPN